MRNQNLGERRSVDVDKLALSLSICLNDTDAPVGSLEEVEHTQKAGAHKACCCKRKSLFTPTLLNEV